MNNQILIPCDLVKEDDLHTLVSSIKAVTDAEAYIEAQFVVTSDSPVLLDTLSKLFSLQETQPQSKIRKPRKPKAKPEKKLSPRSYRIVGGEAPAESIGTVLSAVQLSRELVARALPLGMVLEHPKRGRVVVSLNGDPDGHYVIKNVEGESHDNT